MKNIKETTIPRWGDKPVTIKPLDLLKEIVSVMNFSRPIFFVKRKNTKISTKDFIYELRAQMITDVEMFFLDKFEPLTQKKKV